RWLVAARLRVRRFAVPHRVSADVTGRYGRSAALANPGERPPKTLVSIKGESRSAVMPGHVRMRVLVVEDEWMLALSIAGLVHRLGGDVVGPIGHLREAVALGEDAPVDAAILDLNLHGEMTFPVAKALQERDVPFLFLTGYNAALVPKEHAA